MRIKEIIWQSRRDFSANFECENCGNTETFKGYDDRFFHDNVVPALKCIKCGKSRKDLGIEEYIETQYPEGFQV